MVSILYVDDEGDLLELGKLFLERSPDFHVDTALSAKAALVSPAIKSCDAIVSDYQMPDMDGIAFLKLVRELFGDIPFILFTGRGREDVVIDAINHGADFYLQKGGDVKAQFAELSHKIRQAVARRKAEHSLVESEKRLTDIINFLPDATVAINGEGVIIAWNREMEELTGVSAATMLGKGDYEYALPFYGERRPMLLDLIFEPDDVIEQKYSHIVRDNNALIADTTLSHLHGREVTLFGKASPLYNTQGEIVGAIEAIRDITDRKKAEDELRAAYEQIAASEEELRGQLDSLEESEKRIKENASRLRFMLGFYNKADDDYKDLLNFAVEGAGTITSSPLGYIAFLNDDESELSMYAWSKSAMKECSLQEKPLVYKTAKTGLWGEAVRQRQPVITNDYAAPSPAKKGYPSGHPEIVRHMNIPVLDAGHVVMVAGVANKSQAYTEDDVEQLSLLMQGLWQALQQRQIKQDLYENEENYRNIINNVQDVFYRSDTRGNLVMASPSITELLGYDSLNEVIGKNIAKEFWFLPEQRQKFIDELEKHGAVKNFEAVLRCKDGRTVTVATSSHYYYATDGSVAGIEGIFHDVTVIKVADQQIHLLASLIDLSPASITVHDGEGRFLYANQRAFDLHGYTREEFMALNLHEIDVPASEELINQRLSSLNQTGIVSFDVEHFRKDGSHLPLHVITQLTRWMDREVIMSVATDRSERIEAERILFEREEQYRKLFEQSNDAIFVADPKTRTITDCNRKAELMTGYSRSELLGMPAATLHPEDVHTVAMEHFQKFLEGLTSSFESALLTRDGRRVEVSINAGPIEVGGQILLIGTFRDITGQKQVQEALREANLKLNLLSSITRHDVTNQLTILQGYAQIAAMEKSNPFIADYLARIITSANIIARQIEFTRTYQELGVKAPVWTRIETVIGPGEIVVPIVYSGTCKGVEIFADPMLERVFFNLFDNAVRHGTHVTEITVRCERAPGGIVVLVEDNGTGIPATDKEKIFARGVGRHTGLGLFLVREILSITGITIKETGIYGQGARFEIFVPEGKYRVDGDGAPFG